MNTPPGERRAGRRGGQSGTRLKILDAARSRFMGSGYRAATMRMIAADAGVDAALISYFFGSKQELFGEAFALRANPAVLIADQLDGPIDQLPRRLMTLLLDTWEDPENRQMLLAIAQAGGEPESFTLTRGFVEEVLAGPIAQRLRTERVPHDDAARCSALLVTQLVGVIYARYVLAVEAVATTPKQQFMDGFLPALSAVLNQFLHRRGNQAD